MQTKSVNEVPRGRRRSFPSGRGPKRAVKIAAAISAGLVVASIGAVGLGQSQAQANQGNSLKPLVHAQGTAFYKESQIDEVWRKVTSSYPEALPGTVKFPRNAPAFFHPGGAATQVFEVGLPETIAARYWRCAWIDDALDASESGGSSRALIARQAIKKYSRLPGVSTVVDVSSYEQQIASYAKSKGKETLTTEFELECGLYTAEGNQR